jgi:hypothetical protein
VAASVWIVVPTYCEADNVAALVAGLRAHAPRGTRILGVDVTLALLYFLK